MYSRSEFHISFIHSIFFKSQSKSRSQTRKTLTFLLDSRGNWGSSKLNELPKVTQLGLLSRSPGISPLLLVFHLQYLSGSGMHAVSVCERTMLQVSWFLSLILIPSIHSLHDKDRRPLLFSIMESRKPQSVNIYEGLIC